MDELTEIVIEAQRPRDGVRMDINIAGTKTLFVTVP